MIEITLPWPDKRLNPNARVHWRKKAVAVKEAKEMAYFTPISYPAKFFAAVTPSMYEWEAKYIFYQPDKRKRDIDNCLSMMKPYQDGVCSAMQIDDSRIKRTILEWGEVVKGGKVVLTLEEMRVA